MATGLWPGRSELQEIAPRVYLTNFFAARQRAKLARHSITHVLVCSADLPAVFESDETLTYKRLPMADNPGFDITPLIPEALAFIDGALADPDARVVVHCAAGGSRSAIMVVAHVVRCARAPACPPELRGLDSVDAALQYVKSKRQVVDPNFGFVEQLQGYSFG